MQFEELKKIWDSQNNCHIYAFDENALHKMIESKKEKANHISNISELLLLSVNIISVAIYIFVIATSARQNVFMYITAAWMFACALYVLINRMGRIKESKNFDRSVSGNLQHAISSATYQLNLSQAMRWNILPLALLTLLVVWDAGKPFWILIVLVTAFAFAFLISGWEHNIHKARKKGLKTLQQKLESEI
ncbi:MAG: hypothetical protein ABUT20_40220 [Bacteroidota bacterium]